MTRGLIARLSRSGGRPASGGAPVSEAEIKTVFERHWKQGFGSIAVDEAGFIQDLILEYRVQNFLEVGMASGISGGLIARMLDAAGGGRFVSVDYDNTFFGDPTKENGFLIDQIYEGAKVTVEKKPFHTSLNVGELGSTFDIAFIDANHQHPWPLIDTLMIAPFLTGAKPMIHHDLRLFDKQASPIGIGPKYLFDQMPHDKRRVAQANDGNIFVVEADLTQEQFHAVAKDGFALPWTLRTPLSETLIEEISTRLTALHAPRVSEAFRSGVKKFNAPRARQG